ncbi:hypothetical protein Tco_0605450 [Tanacetum coccineum]
MVHQFTMLNSNENVASPLQTACGSLDMEKLDVGCSLEKVMMMDQNMTAEDDKDEGVAENMDGGALIEGARTQAQPPTIPILKGASKKSSMEISYNKKIVRIAKEGPSIPLSYHQRCTTALRALPTRCLYVPKGGTYKRRRIIGAKFYKSTQSFTP